MGLSDKDKRDALPDSLKAAFEAYSMERDENKPGQKKTGY